MVKNYFISYIENDNILRKAMEDISLLPDVEKASYQSFQQMIKVTCRPGTEEERLRQDIADILHNYDETIRISEKMLELKDKLDRRNLALFGAGLALYLLTYFFLPASFQWLGFLGGLLLSGKVLLRKVWTAGFEERRLHESMLILLAVIGAYLIRDYLEAMLVLSIYLVADFLSWKASLTARKDVSETLHKEATQVYLLKGKVVLPTPIREIREGDVIVVRPGEVIPLFSKVLEGRSAVDMSPVSEESFEIEAGPGTEVISGGVNLSSPLKLQVLKPYNEGMLKELITKTEEAMESKKGFARTSERIASLYIRLIGVLALILLLSSFFSSNPSQSIYKGLTLLAVSSPWAMLLSTPIAYNYALSRAKKLDILIKDIASIDALGRLRSIFFTKTGILTTGEFQVKEVIPYKNNKEEHILTYGAIGELKARHPMGQAIRNHRKLALSQEPLEKYREEKGRGAIAVYGGKTIIAGTESFLLDHNIDASNDYQGIQVHVGVDGEYVGAIALEETLKEEGSRMIEKLRALGIQKVAVITGEGKSGAEGVLAPLKVSNVYGDLNLEEKVSRIRKEKKLQKGRAVGFVGDTLSDGVVMAASDVSLAFLKDGRLDRVTEAADVVILKEDLSRIPDAVSLGKRTYRIILENIFISLSAKGVLLLYLLTTEVRTGFMLLAIGIDLLVSLITIANCFRITRSHGELGAALLGAFRSLIKAGKKDEEEEEEEGEEEEDGREDAGV